MASAEELYRNAHVIIDSVPYQLDEGNTQEHYVRGSEPLRPANAQLVQGGDQQMFQLRQDILQFRMEDFAGGAGQYSFEPQERNRLWEIYGCDAFSNPGQIGPGMRFAPQVDDTSPDPVRLGDGIAVYTSNNLYFVSSAGEIYRYDQTNWQWDGTGIDWTTEITSTDSTYPGIRLAGGVNDLRDYIYFAYNSDEATTKVIIKRLNCQDGSWATITDGTDFSGSARVNSGDYLLCLGDALIFSLGRGKSHYQVSDAAGSTPELLYSLGRRRANYGTYGFINSLFDSGRLATAINNRVYFTTESQGQTLIHEIIPKNASNVGYGRVLIELTGVSIGALWGHLGHLYAVGYENSRRAGDNRRAFNGIQTYYIDLVNGVFGTVGNPDYGYRATSSVYASPNVGALTTSMFTQSEPRDEPGSAGSAEGSLAVWEINQLTGGFQAVSYITGINDALNSGATETAPAVWGPVRFGDLLFFSLVDVNGADSSELIGLVPYDNYVGDADGATLASEHWFITPWIDFNIANDKALASLTTVWDETITSNWQVQIEAQLDSDEASWIDLDSTDFAPDGSSVVESWTPSASWFTTDRTFSRVRFRVTFTLPSGTFDLQEAPRLTTLEAKASVSFKVKTWDLILNLTDETAYGGRSADELIDNLLTLEDNDAVFPFVDLYYHGSPDIYTGLDGDSLPAPYINARLDRINVVLERPGQGYAMVRIVEAI